MNIIFFVILLFARASGLMAATDVLPPEVFVDKGACPFECCVYRQWTVTKDTKLLNSIHGSTTVTTVKKGESVKAKTGEVHTRPTVVEVSKSFLNFKKGDKIYVLTYLGEGIYKIWYNGKIMQDDQIYCLVNPTKNVSCEFSGRVLKHGESEWWIQAESKKGIIGWTKDADNFGEMDACG